MIAVDTSVIVAALQSWHDHHEIAWAALNDALRSQQEVLIPDSVLLESFSVMTRLPVPHRLDPTDALELLRQTLESSTQVVALPAGERWNLLQDLSERRVVGGAVYDAAIIECARRAGASTILTLNRKHFERLAPAGLRVVTPDTGTG